MLKETLGKLPDCRYMQNVMRDSVGPVLMAALLLTGVIAGCSSKKHAAPATANVVPAALEPAQPWAPDADYKIQVGDELHVPVLGSGHPLGDVFLLKYRPAHSEIAEGVAFFGRSGQALLKSLQRLAVDPLAVYGTNCLKFGTEDPAVARGWLTRELHIVQPKLLVAMGEETVAFVNAPPSLRKTETGPHSSASARSGSPSPSRSLKAAPLTSPSAAKTGCIAKVPPTEWEITKR